MPVNTNNDLTELKSLLDDAVSAYALGNNDTGHRLVYNARMKLYSVLSGPLGSLHQPGVADRPDFVVKVTDPHAPAMVLYWISLACEADVSSEKRKRAMAHYERVVQWQKDNPEQVKIPD